MRLWHVKLAGAVMFLLALASVGAQEALTNNRYKDWHPVLRPDGRTLVYLSKRITTDLWAMDLATRKERRLTNSREREKGACFSPDSTRIAFLAMRKLLHRIQVLDIATLKIRDLGPGDDVAWSPAGKHLAARDAKGLFIIDAHSGARRRLVTASRAGIESIQWGRGGEVIYYLHEGDLWRVSVKDKAECQMLFRSKVEDKRANFIYFRPGPRGRRFVAVLDFGRLAILNKDQGILLGPGPQQRKRLGPMERPVWPPDGRGLIFCRGGNVYRLMFNEPDPQRIAGEDNGCESAVVSPDGRWVYFAARNPERRGAGGRTLSKYTEIYRMLLPQ